MAPAPAELRFQGTALSPGVAIGRACFISHKTCTPANTGSTDSHGEKQRLAMALVWMARRLEMLADKAAVMLGIEDAEIFRAYRMLLEDTGFQQQLYEDIATPGVTAETALKKQLAACRLPLAGADSAYLQQRSADIADIEQSILDHLASNDPCRCCRETADCRIDTCHLGNDHILIGRALTTCLPIELDSHTVGFLVEKGSYNSHAVILARALRLPVIANVPSLPHSVPLDSRVLINGDAGEVILNPTEKTLSRLRRGMTGRVHAVPVHEPVPGLRAMANIGCAGDVHQALAARADGIGLYRTEIECLAGKQVPGEAEQEERYRAVVDAMEERPVTVRLLDLGGDKQADWLGADRLAGSAAGCRGAGLLLAHPELLRDQARALARAAFQRPIDILYPMIVDVEQFLRLKSLFESYTAGMPPALLRHGVMFEVPSACLQAAQILEVADFGSIGTNDLVHYLFADQRFAATASGRASFENNVVLWQLISDIARAAKQAGKPLSICGELAGKPEFIRRIMQAGITRVSTSPVHIAAVRQAAKA